METHLQAEGLVKALGAALSFWLIGTLGYTGDLAAAATGKGRALHFLVDVLLVGLLGKPGAIFTFGALGVIAAALILRNQATP